MFKLLRSKDGLLTVAAWFAIWLMLEMVFFGEPMFRYSSSGAGYQFYLIGISLVSILSVAIGASPQMMSVLIRHLAKPPLAIAVSALSSLSLFTIRLAVDPGFPLTPEPFLLVATACFVATAVPLICLWAERTMDLVFEHGLRSVLALILTGIALAFCSSPAFCATALMESPSSVSLRASWEALWSQSARTQPHRSTAISRTKAAAMEMGRPRLPPNVMWS